MLLDQMERLARKDLRDFSRKHNVQLPIARRDQVLLKILEKTEGCYEQTVEEMKNLVDLAWDVQNENQSVQHPEADTEDW